MAQWLIAEGADLEMRVGGWGTWSIGRLTRREGGKRVRTIFACRAGTQGEAAGLPFGRNSTECLSTHRGEGMDTRTPKGTADPHHMARTFI